MVNLLIWFNHVMPFFELPTPLPVNDSEEFYDDGTAQYVPVVLPFNRIIAQTDEAAVVITSLAAFPDGVEIAISSFSRGDLRKKLSRSHNPQGSIMADGIVPDEFLRVGTLFANGAKATNLQAPWFRTSEDEAVCGLEPQGGGGNGSDYNQTFWIWPLPMDGPFTVVCEWPAAGIQETSIVLDGTELREAGKHSTSVWPDEVGKPSRMGYGGSHGGFSTFSTMRSDDRETDE